MRRLKTLLLVIFVLIVLLALTGFSCDRILTARDRRSYPPRGRLINVDGRTIHLYCLGEGSPTVVLDAGGFDSLEQWRLVQPLVTGVTRVCSYDRPGFGWSDSGQFPQTATEVAAELHGALAADHVAGPYVLVGHSVSGLYVRAFAAAHPSEIAGMVLDDSVHPDELQRFPSHFPRHSFLFGVLRFTARFGVPRLLHFCKQTGAKPDCARFVSALLRGLPAVEKSYAEVGQLGTLRDLPLIVLSHDPAEGLDKHTTPELEAAWMQWQKDLSRLSSNSSLLVVRGAGHEIQTERPDIVAESIANVVSAARSSTHRLVPNSKSAELFGINKRAKTLATFRPRTRSWPSSWRRTRTA